MERKRVLRMSSGQGMISPVAAAAMHGHLECLRFLVRHACPWDDLACMLAARNGHLTCLRFLHGEGHRIGPIVAYMAVAFGQIEVLCWLIAERCILMNEVDLACVAAAHGHVHCLQLLINGLERSPRTDDKLLSAAVQGDSEASLQHLLEQGFSWNQTESCSIRLMPGTYRFAVLAGMPIRLDTTEHSHLAGEWAESDRRRAELFLSDHLAIREPGALEFVKRHWRARMHVIRRLELPEALILRITSMANCPSQKLTGMR